MDSVKLAQIAREIGALGVLVILVIGGWRGWYVFRWTYDAHIDLIRRERDEWKRIALSYLKKKKLR